MGKLESALELGKKNTIMLGTCTRGNVGALRPILCVGLPVRPCARAQHFVRSTRSMGQVEQAQTRVRSKSKGTSVAGPPRTKRVGPTYWGTENLSACSSMPEEALLNDQFCGEHVAAPITQQEGASCVTVQLCQRRRWVVGCMCLNQ